MQIGCFVYQYAKLQVLEFNYDFMNLFVDRRDFQYCAMDTCSADMAFPTASLEEVIKPDMQQRYQMEQRIDFHVQTPHSWQSMTREHLVCLRPNLSEMESLPCVARPTFVLVRRTNLAAKVSTGKPTT